jgi:hypothetical protein
MATVHMSYLILVYLALWTTVHNLVYLIIESSPGIPVHRDYCTLVYLVIRTALFWYTWSQVLKYSGILYMVTRLLDSVNLVSKGYCSLVYLVTKVNAVTYVYLVTTATVFMDTWPQGLL